MRSDATPHERALRAVIAAIATSASLWAVSSHAGRPLTVDDANVNDVGVAHVETWLERQADGSRLWVVAPAYGVANGVEIGASAARDTTNQLNTFAVQAKFRLTPSQPEGCNAGAAIGVAQTRGGAGFGSVNTPFVNGLFTCNLPAGALHLNLGVNRTAGSPTLTTWGLAFERIWSRYSACGVLWSNPQHAHIPDRRAH